MKRYNVKYLIKRNKQEKVVKFPSLPTMSKKPVKKPKPSIMQKATLTCST